MGRRSHPVFRQSRGSSKTIRRPPEILFKNKIIVDEAKTKVMCFGTNENFQVFFNKKLIEEVDQCKYLGVIVRSINKTNQDLFSSNNRFTSDKSQKAIFNMKKKLKFVKSLSPIIMFDMVDTLIRPILNYGSNVWGLSRTGLESLDKVFLNYVRCILCIKATTCNAIVYGECGRYPPSVTCHVNVLCFYISY